ncbi:facilitated trehalose transporter Tret1-2 homolog [Argiope bruennichi]|uniref:Facilitated trehalose transporter Tret1 like protein n=1 Tax=Argiope bruennichi TaxID=94029 RepID=A0A8T0F977_ARGBR|nr:facilitated trehalose transporter Tret1-2 homolog [Argiope bruennichi]KAF8785553.1 Facilitated trehalose transporter Tret1 like protein [Argiope bruennichi]
MEDLHRDVKKLRSSSAASSTSSVTEYVNEVFTESELELSRGVSIQVTDDTQWIKNPLSDVRNDSTQSKGMENVVGFSHDSEESDDGDKSFLTSIKNIRKMFVAALIVLLFAINMGITATYSATATTDMEKPSSPIHPDGDQVTWIGSLMAIGALIGGTAGGYLTNSLGRKGTLVLNTAPFVIGWLCVAYAKTIGMIYAGRVITGFCSGIVSVATPMYLVEISTPEVRGLLGASFQLFVVIGVLIVSILGSQQSWQYLAISGASASLIAAFLMIPMPESPKWLMGQKRRGEAKNAIIFLQGKSHDAEDECVKMEDEIQSQPKGNVQLSEFKSPTLYKPFILSIALMFFQQFSGVNAILFYTANIFKSAGSSVNPITATIYVNIIQVIATLISSILMDKAGRKALLLFSGICMAVSFIVLGGFDLARTNNPAVADKYGWLPLVCLMSFIAAFSLGFGPTPWLMVAEMTPIRFRGIVSGIATALNWTFAFIVTKTFKMEEASMHGYGVYWMYASLHLASLVVTFLYLPETKGKSIEEIQEFFEGKKSRSFSGQKESL